MTRWYAQNGSEQYPAAWGSCYWNDQANGSGNSGTPASGDTADANGHTGIDVSDVDLTGITLSPVASNAAWVSSNWYARASNCTWANAAWNSEASGKGIAKLPIDSIINQYIHGNSHVNIDIADVDWSWKNAYNYDYSAFWSSKAYASGSTNWNNVYWYSADGRSNGHWGQTIGTLASPPSGSSTTYYLNTYTVDVADIDLRNITRSDPTNAAWTSTKFYARSSAAWASVTWNTEANGYGLSKTPTNTSGVSVDSGSYTVDCAGIATSNLSMNGYGWVSSTWCAQGSGAWGSISWNARGDGTGISYSNAGTPNTTATVYHQGYDVDIADVDVHSNTLSVTGAGHWTSSKWYARANATWASALWNTRADGNGTTSPGPQTTVSPATQNTCDLNGHAVALSAACNSLSRISVTDSSYSGSLGVGADCTLTNWQLNCSVTWSSHTLTLSTDCQATSGLTVSGTGVLVCQNAVEASITVNSGGVARVATGGTLTCDGLTVNSGGAFELYGNLTPNSSLSIASGGTLRIYGAGKTLGGSWGSLAIASGATVTAGPADGDYTDPGQANVRHGATYYQAAALKTGTAYIPAAGDVRLGTHTDATTGTCHVPTAQQTQSGVPVDVADTGTFTHTGDYVAIAGLPSVDDVRAGTDRGDGSTGNLIVPSAAHLESGYHAGWKHTSPDSYEVTGTLDLSAYVLKSDVVDAAYVLSGHNIYTGGDNGSLTLPAASAVWYGSGAYGVAGTGSTPSKRASSITNCTAAKVKAGVAIDDVTGTYDPMAAAVFPQSQYVSTAVTQYGPTGADYAGSLNLSNYVLKSDVVDAGYVVTGHSNYYGGSSGSYPTSTTSYNNGYSDGESARSSSDVAAVTAAKSGITTSTTILGVTGTYSGGGTVPAASDVRHGVSVGATTGTAYIPAAGDVRYGVNVDATTGTVHVPTAAQTQSGVSVDVSGTGTFTHTSDYVAIAGLPSVDNVRAGTDRGDGSTGNLIVPAAGYVATGVHAGWHHTGPDTYEVTGTMDGGGGGGGGTVPAAGDVRYGVAVGSTTGTCHVPTASQVLYGVDVDVASTGTVTLPNTDGSTPDASLVLNTASFGPGNATTGTLDMAAYVSVDYLPTASAVLNGVDRGDGTIGTLTLPSTDDVRSGVNRGDGNYGSLIVPTAAQLLLNAHAGWSHGGNQYEVTGILVPIDMAPAGQATGTLTVYGNDGLVKPGAVIYVQQKSLPGDDTQGHTYSTTMRAIVSVVGGVVVIPHMWQGAQYDIWMGRGKRTTITVPEKTDTFEVTSFLGDDGSGAMVIMQ